LYDVVFIDGPHGYPFPELEYYYFYQHINVGGLFIIDDVNIPTIGRLADFLAEDEMFELVSLVRTTAVFRRTNAKLFDPRGDGWWTQRYNRHRISSRREFFLPSENVRDIFSSRRLDLLVHGESSTRYDFEPLIGLQKKCHDLELAHQSPFESA